MAESCCGTLAVLPDEILVNIIQATIEKWSLIFAYVQIDSKKPRRAHGVAEKLRLRLVTSKWKSIFDQLFADAFTGNVVICSYSDFTHHSLNWMLGPCWARNRVTSIVLPATNGVTRSHQTPIPDNIYPNLQEIVYFSGISEVDRGLDLTQSNKTGNLYEHLYFQGHRESLDRWARLVMTDVTVHGAWIQVARVNFVLKHFFWGEATHASHLKRKSLWKHERTSEQYSRAYLEYVCEFSNKENEWGQWGDWSFKEKRWCASSEFDTASKRVETGILPNEDFALMYMQDLASVG